MKHFLGMGASLLMCCYLPTFAQPPQPSTIVDLRYNVQSECSRIKIVFQGAIHYVGSRTDTSASLSFYNTRLGSPPGSKRWNFSDGMVKRAGLSRGTGDTVHLILALRSPSRFVFSQNNEDGELFIDVVNQAAALQALAKNSNLKNAETVSESPEYVPPRVSPRPKFVDIPTIARTESEQLTKSEQQVVPNNAPEKQRELHQNSVDQGGGIQDFLTILWIAILGAAVGTGVVVLIMTRLKANVGKPEKDEPIEMRNLHEALKAYSSHPVPEPFVLGKPTNDPQSESTEEYIEEDQSNVSSIASSMKRGRGEAELAFALKRGLDNKKLSESLKSKLPGKPKKGSKDKLAKKFGLGKGEINLALGLRDMERKKRKN